MAKGPLNGIRVVEIEGIGPAPFCGMHLADLGADVILVERKTKGTDPAAQMPVGITRRGKRSIALDLKKSEDVATVLDLVGTADALIEGMRPGVMERLGLSPEICLKRNPRLVYGRVTGWGQSGPLAQVAGHDLNYIALSSAAWYASAPGEPPVPPPTLIGDIGGGAHYLMIGLLAGILRARATGEGDVVDAAMVDGSAHMMNLLFDIMPRGMMRNERGHSLLDGPAWYGTYRCADRHFVTIGSLEPKFYAEFIRRMGLDSDPLFESQFDSALWPQQVARIREIFATKTRDEWRELLEGTDVCFSPVLSPHEASAHPHNAERGIFDVQAGYLQAVAAPRFQSTGAGVPGRSPAHGEHGAEILRELKKARPKPKSARGE